MPKLSFIKQNKKKLVSHELSEELGGVHNWKVLMCLRMILDFLTYHRKKKKQDGD